MNIRLSIQFLILLTACNSGSGDKTINKLPAGDLSQKKNTIKVSYDTLQINNEPYIQAFSNNKFNFLLSGKGDTIVKKEDFYSEVKFLDINEDGYSDIRVYFFSNFPNQCDNYFFSNKTKKFKLVENCDLDIKKIKGTNFYFSYNKAGCADMNWESYLSKIENNILVNYGYIYGQGCDSRLEESPQMIEIYKVSEADSTKKKLIQRFPYLKYIPNFEGKWSFIENYWKQNYRVFDR